MRAAALVARDKHVGACRRLVAAVRPAAQDGLDEAARYVHVLLALGKPRAVDGEAIGEHGRDVVLDVGKVLAAKELARLLVDRRKQLADLVERHAVHNVHAGLFPGKNIVDGEALMPSRDLVHRDARGGHGRQHFGLCVRTVRHGMSGKVCRARHAAVGHGDAAQRRPLVPLRNHEVIDTLELLHPRCRLGIELARLKRAHRPSRRKRGRTKSNVFVHKNRIRSSRKKRDVETGLLVVAVLLRGNVASKLRLQDVLQLHGDAIDRGARGVRAARGKGKENQGEEEEERAREEGEGEHGEGVRVSAEGRVGQESVSAVLRPRNVVRSCGAFAQIRPLGSTERINFARFSSFSRRLCCF